MRNFSTQECRKQPYKSAGISGEEGEEVKIFKNIDFNQYKVGKQFECSPPYANMPKCPSTKYLDMQNHNSPDAT